ADDYINLISEKCGIKMVVEPDLTWAEAYAKAAKGEIDVLPCVSKTAEREAIFLYSNPYYYFNRAIYVQEDNNTITSMYDLSGQMVAVQADSSHEGYLRTFTDINLSLFSTVGDALKAVSKGTELAYVGNEDTSNYLVQEYGITNLKSITIVTASENGLYFAVRKDWPELTSILNKCLASITKKERLMIDNNWSGVDKALAYQQNLRTIIVISSVIAFGLILSFYWIIRLRKQVKLRMVAEQNLKQLKEEAETENELKSIFLARMSHEIRTPLNAITGMTYLLGKTDVSSAQKLYLDKITHAAKSMLGIINDILDFSKIEAGKIVLEKLPFSLDTTLEQVVNIISYKVEEQGLEFSIHKDSDVPTFFYGDSLRLQQILINLINNAIKFTKKGFVRASISLVSKTNDSCILQFKIEDTGIGMSPDQLKAIFQSFGQGDETISRKFGGTGLGLTISKNLIELMGGEVHVESTEDVGSTFLFTVSLTVDATQEYNDSSIKASIDFNTLSILVIEKSPFYTNLLRDYLTNFHISFDFASSGEQGISKLVEANKSDKKSYDLILLDYLTPTENGIEYYGNLIELFPRLPKCILMIPIAREYIFEKIEEAGISIGIMKPFMPSTLFNSILELTKKKIVNLPPISKVTTTGDATTMVSAHILVVDDNKTNQMIAESILSQIGCQISLANDGKEGYEFFVAHQDNLDLILMDLHMPVLNGLESSELIRKIDKEIPIIAMTADAITGIEDKCKASGINFYISKPFDPEMFLQTIIDVLKSREEAPTPAINIAETISRIGTNKAFFLEILKQFFIESVDIAQDITDAIDSDNYQAAADIAHKLKSSSGNIGANDLYKITSELNAALKANDQATASELLPPFLLQLDRVLKEVAKLINS
ncbi:MAG: transporter substrate-binding domain-containing protein, partial [Mobilitalea sp.]